MRSLFVLNLMTAFLWNLLSQLLDKKSIYGTYHRFVI